MRLSGAILRDVKSILGYGDDAVSIALEETPPSDWTAKVYKPHIVGKWDKLIKEPGDGARPRERGTP
jgi:4-oxalocrotonate tautomerase